MENQLFYSIESFINSRLELCCVESMENREMLCERCIGYIQCAYINNMISYGEYNYYIDKLIAFKYYGINREG